MPTATFESVFSAHRISLPNHINPDDLIPAASRFWAQGDVYAKLENNIQPREGQGIPAQFIKVIEGDADRNAHILDCVDGTWYPGAYVSELVDYGVVYVPDHSFAYLTHTGEHGSVALAPGLWRLFGQIEFAETIRRVMD
jgi:hypothetical protein